MDPYEPPRTPVDRETSRRWLEHGWFARREPAGTSWEIVMWWEKRRPIYNGALALIGAPFLAYAIHVALACGGADWMDRAKPEPVLSMLVWAMAYGVVANVCYTGGWWAELVLARVLRVDGQRLAPYGLLAGMVFGVGVTLVCGGVGVLATRDIWCGDF